MGSPREPFLTDLDLRARVKGSRDPLGAQPVWTHFGRQVIGNLTTVSNSLRDFTSLLLGYYFAERVAAQSMAGSELETFLKWEQLSAYSRAQFNSDFAFRGTERVRAALQSSTRVVLSSAQSSQILSNQKTYGLWGLYSVPSATSGLVEQDPARLTTPALEFVERHHLPAFRKAGFPNADRLVKLLSQPECRLDIRGAESALCECIAGLLKTKVLASELEFYRDHLIKGGPKDSTKGIQALLSDIMERLERESGQPLGWSPTVLRELAKRARALGKDGETLAHRLDRIRVCESVIAPAAWLYSFLQGFHGKKIDDAARRIKETWGPKVKTINISDAEALGPELDGISEGAAKRWIGFADALHRGDYASSCRLLIEQNQVTMELRDGVPWIEERKGQVHVRVRDEQGSLPNGENLSSLWRFPYFLDSLAALTRQLRAS